MSLPLFLSLLQMRIIRPTISRKITKPHPIAPGIRMYKALVSGIFNSELAIMTKLICNYLLRKAFAVLNLGKPLLAVSHTTPE